jgi:translation initiation factor RLI1
MNEDVVTKIFTELDTAVDKAVNKYVNGHLKDMKAHLERQDLKLEQMERKVDALKPLREGLTVVNIVRKFLLWATPAAAILWGFLKFVANR